MNFPTIRVPSNTKMSIMSPALLKPFSMSEMSGKNALNSHLVNSREKETQPADQIVLFKTKAGYFHPRDIQSRTPSADHYRNPGPKHRLCLPRLLPPRGPEASISPTGSASQHPPPPPGLDWRHAAQNIIVSCYVEGSCMVPGFLKTWSRAITVSFLLNTAQNSKLGLVAHACNLYTHKAESERSKPA